MKLGLLFVCACGLMVGIVQAKEKPAKSDKDALQGSWSAVSGSHEGKEMTADELKSIKVIFAGDKLTLKHGDESSEHTFKLASDKSPKEIDVDFDGKPGKGIYVLDGDTLKIAHGELGGDRPKDFTSKEGSKVSVAVFKRDKKK
jgi:uncharacterized protein (TIGR03067 family)